MRDFKVIFHQLSLPLREKISLSCILTSGNWSMKWEISSAVESKYVTLFINFMISWRLWFFGQTQPECFWIEARIKTSSGEGCWVSPFDYLHRDAMTNVVSNQKGKKTTTKPEALMSFSLLWEVWRVLPFSLPSLSLWPWSHHITAHASTCRLWSTVPRICLI